MNDLFGALYIFPQTQGHIVRIDKIFMTGRNMNSHKVTLQLQSIRSLSKNK